MRTRNRRPAAWAALAAAFLIGLTACGSDTTAGAAEAATGQSAADSGAGSSAGEGADTVDGELGDISDAAAAAQDILQGAVDATADGAGARVTIDGATYEFRVVSEETGTLAYSYCTAVGGTLQGMMQLVDEQGQGIEGGELEFFLPAPGSIAEQEGDVPEFYFTVPEDESSPVWSRYQVAEIDAPVDGSSLSGGSFTMQNSQDSSTLSGTFDISC